MACKTQAKETRTWRSAHDLELRQGQSLVITPQLQQAIKLLQLSNLELEAYRRGRAGAQSAAAARRGRRCAGARGGADREPRRRLDAATDFAAGGDAEAEIDARHDDLYADASPGERATGDAGETPAADAGGAIDWSRAGGKGGSFDTDGEGLEGALTREKTLPEHLHDQLAVGRPRRRPSAPSPAC